ncbi:hypothetical protein BDZ89DRAFT_1055836 [Hymenopellis radicata]|nr:hypothetical protein BDZ89DRAFT_1055836 [Hymenopellis radicata]
MDTHNKRVLTDSLYASNTASNAPTSPATAPDWSAALRSVSSRVRKSNVTEGYNTNRFTRTHGPSRAHSTGEAIFSSANDTLLDVYSSSSLPTSSTTRKRSLEDDVEEDGDSDATPTPEVRMSVDDGFVQITNRPMKPLRRSAFGKTQSSPAAFGPGPSSSAHMLPLPTATEEEEDWSTELGAFKDRVEPMVF